MIRPFSIEVYPTVVVRDILQQPEITGNNRARVAVDTPAVEAALKIYRWHVCLVGTAVVARYLLRTCFSESSGVFP